jgi:malonyl CoA-acyl carrier protein transacylase
VNPLRVNKSFGESHLKFLIQLIEEHTKGLLQIVNYNVENIQYVVAGDLLSLETLRIVLDQIAEMNPITIFGTLFDTQTTIQQQQQQQQQQQPIAIQKLLSLIDNAISTLQHKKAKNTHLILERGKATLPLAGIDVPFHSRFLLHGVPTFRNYLYSKIDPSLIDIDALLGKYIPNLIAKPYTIDRDYIFEVYEITKSTKLKTILDGWEMTTSTSISTTIPTATATKSTSTSLSLEERQKIGYLLLIELLSYQFAMPVQWIQTQDQIFGRFNIERLIEIGAAPTLANMALQTLKMKYQFQDNIHGIQRSVLCSAKNMSEISYQLDSSVQLEREHENPPSKASSTSSISTQSQQASSSNAVVSTTKNDTNVRTSSTSSSESSIHQTLDSLVPTTTTTTTTTTTATNESKPIP